MLDSSAAPPGLVWTPLSYSLVFIVALEVLMSNKTTDNVTEVGKGVKAEGLLLFADDCDFITTLPAKRLCLCP